MNKITKQSSKADVNIWLDQLVQEFELSDEDINKLAQLKDMNGMFFLFRY